MVGALHFHIETALTGTIQWRRLTPAVHPPNYWMEDTLRQRASTDFFLYWATRSGETSGERREVRAHKVLDH